MGLQSLKSKISDAIERDFSSQEQVLYILAETHKYLERSRKDLGDPFDLRLPKEDYQTISFFRNWALHPHKHNSDIPGNIKKLLQKITVENNDKIESELFTLLRAEIDSFYNKVSSSKKEIPWNTFVELLKEILVEQPIKISSDHWVGYIDDSLKLSVWKTA